MQSIEIADDNLNSTSNRMPRQVNRGQGQGSKPRGQRRVKKILVVDDHRAWLKIASTILSAAGYQVQVCEDPLDALLLFKESPGQIDLVITDLDMPNLDGIELAAELLKINSALSIVLTSVTVVELNSVMLQTLGIQDFVPKPWKPERLLSVVRQALASGHPREETK